MPVLDSIHLALDDALGFGALTLTISMMVALAVCVTLLLQATTAGYVARRLNLLEL